MRFVRKLSCLMLVLTGVLLPAPQRAAFDDESVRVFGLDCVTPKTLFVLGEQVCAMASGAPQGPPAQRRFVWIAPDGTILPTPTPAEISDDPHFHSITLPTAGRFAQAGVWRVRSVDVSNNPYAEARFNVQDDRKAAADLSVSLSAPSQITAGANLAVTLIARNLGPNEAEQVQLKIAVANNARLLSAEQTSGLPFACAAPLQGGTNVCAIEKLPPHTEAGFALVYQVEQGTTDGISITTAATISSLTAELNATDNTATATATIAPQPCTLACPQGVVVAKPEGACSALVNYSLPTTTGSNCGGVTCTPPPGAFFPVGTTAVTCAGNTGQACSFTVTVDDGQPPTLSCPADVRVTEAMPGQGLAVVKYKAPTLNGDCVVETATCAPPSGSSFPVGATTVTCEIRNAAGERGECSFTVTVESSDCELLYPTGAARSNKPNECGAVVTYAPPKTRGDCGAVTCTPPSGTFFPVGTTAVSCLSSTGTGGSFDVIVQDTQPPVIRNVAVTPASLGRATGAMKDVLVTYETTDNCAGELTAVLSVASNEPQPLIDAKPAVVASQPVSPGVPSSAKDEANKDEKTGRENSAPESARRETTPRDWEVIDARRLRLRAARSANDRERVYRVTITCTDASGNATSVTVQVTVPRS